MNAFRELCGPYDSAIARELRPNTLRALFGENKVLLKNRVCQYKLNIYKCLRYETPFIVQIWKKTRSPKWSIFSKYCNKCLFFLDSNFIKYIPP